MATSSRSHQPPSISSQAFKSLFVLYVRKVSSYIIQETLFKEEKYFNEKLLAKRDV